MTAKYCSVVGLTLTLSSRARACSCLASSFPSGGPPPSSSFLSRQESDAPKRRGNIHGLLSDKRKRREVGDYYLISVLGGRREINRVDARRSESDAAADRMIAARPPPLSLSRLRCLHVSANKFGYFEA